MVCAEPRTDGMVKARAIREAALTQREGSFQLVACREDQRNSSYSERGQPSVGGMPH